MADPVFFEASRAFTVADIATLTGARLATPQYADLVVDRLAAIDSPTTGSLVFADGRKHAARLGSLSAAALLCSAELAEAAGPGIAVLVSTAPQRDFAMIGRTMFPTSARPGPVTGEAGISPAAHVHATARIESGATIEAGAVVGARAGIGSGSVIGPNAVIGHDCQIGRDCFVGPSATLQYALVGNGVIIHGGVRIGQDGFGFVAGRAGPEKMPQLGRVVIQDNVEIGANSTVDRGALSDTIIGEATKIDNLVQIAHNVRIGRMCLIAAQCGISGSVVMGDGIMLGGDVGITDHVTIGSGAAIAAGSGIMRDVPPGTKWGGAPARPIRDYLREVAMLTRLTSERAKGRRDD